LNALKKWLLEKAAVESLERSDLIPEGTSKAMLGYTLYMVTPDPIKSALFTTSQRVVGRGIALVDSPRGFKPGTHQPSGRSLYADTSTGRYRGPLPGSRPATVRYGVPRIGGGMLSLPALNLGMGIMVAGPVLEWMERDSYITDAT